MSDDAGTILAAAVELYGLPGPAFVAHRTAAAREARRSGAPREVVAALGRLPRAAPSAEALDRLLRADPTALADALAAGAAVRAAHATGAAGDVRSAAERLRAAASRAARRAATVLEAEGRAQASLVPRLEETVRAAALDAAAAVAVASGLLVRPLVSTGLEPVDVDGAVAVPDAPPLDGVPGFPADVAGPPRLTLVQGGRPAGRPGSRPAGTDRPAPEAADEPGGDRGRAAVRGTEQAGRRAVQRRAAIVDLDEASRLASAALDRASEAEAALGAAQEGAGATLEELDRTTREIARLTERLRQLRDTRVADDRVLRRARAEHEGAGAAAAAALARREAARRRLDRLGPGAV